MSEEFLRVARKEVSEDVSEIGNLLQHCTSDEDVKKNMAEIEKRIHKLKGLAPMMGQEDIGETAALLDLLFKVMLEGKTVQGIYSVTKQAHQLMHDKLRGVEADFSPLKSMIKENYGQFIQ